MGKLSSIIQFKGKVGEVVGYAYKDSANQKATGLRKLQLDVKNPQSVAQCRQRAKLKPLNSFYRMMKSTIDRGYQQVGYGEASLRLFRRVNLNDFNGPWLEKGDSTVVPGPFVISQGSLVPVVVTGFQNNFAETDLTLSGEVPTTIAALSAGLIAGNTDIRQGDQLTFVCVAMVNGQLPSFVYRVASVVIDTNDTTALPITVGINSVDNEMQFHVGLRNDETIAAAAVIQSRDGDGNIHLRSNATLTVNQAAVSQWFGTDAFDAAIASYQTAAGTNDWPVTRFGGQASAQNPITIAGTTYYGIAKIEGTNYYGLVDANGTTHHLRNVNDVTVSYEKYLGATTWVSGPDTAPEGTVAVGRDAWDTLCQWLITTQGYQLSAIYS